MAKIDPLDDVGSLANTTSARAVINSNSQKIEDAFANTVSRDGSGPNQMEADIDLNDHYLLNVADPVNEADGVNLRSVRPLVEAFASQIVETAVFGTQGVDSFIATAAQTVFTLSDSPGSIENVAVFIDGSALRPATDFSLSGADLRTLTLTTPLAGGEKVLIRYSKALPSGITQAQAITYTPPITGAPGTVKDYLDSLQGDTGSSLVRFKRTATGALPITLEQKLLPTVDAIEFGVVADGITDCSTFLQNAINYCAANEMALQLPAGDIALTSGLTHSSGSLYLRGSQAGTQGTRLLIKADAPAITITDQATIENIGFIGEQNGTKTLQAGIYINNTNNVNVRDCVFSGCYDSIKLLDTCFYVDFTGLRMFDCVRAHFYGTGVTAPGYAFQVSRMMMTPGQGQYGFYLENVGSIVISDSVMSPANLTERCFRWVSNATLSGDSRFSNVVFEGSVKEALRIEGTALAPIKYAYFTNCYFNQSGVGQDAITLGYVDGISFVNSYISGTGAACTIYGDAKRVRFVNTDLPGGGSVAMFRAISGSVDGLEIISPAYTGSNRLLDLSALTAPNTKNVRVRGGNAGSHATPVVGVSEGLISTDHWISYSAGAPVPGSGSFTSASVSTARYRRDGNTMHVMFEVTVTTNGTADGSISVNLPIVTAQPSVLIGRERNAFGYTVTGTIASTIGAGIQALLKKYDDTYPGGTGAIITVTGQYEVAA